MIPIVIFPLWALVAGTVIGLAALAITAEWGASRLTSLQKFLAKKLRARK